MKNSPTQRRAVGFIGIIAALIIALVIALQHTQLSALWLSWKQQTQPVATSLQLANYRAVIQALPIEGVADDLSALTYNPDSRTLVSVTNNNPQWIELDTQGRVLRQIPLVGFSDPEAIEYIAPNKYIISDERRQRLVKVTVTKDTQQLNAEDFPQLSLDIGNGGNKGFEGLAFDRQGQRLFVAKERDPVQIYQVLGFPPNENGPSQIHISEDHQRDASSLLKDLSSLDFDQNSGHLLALSDESKLLLEMDQNGKPVSSLSLKAGKNGLMKSVPQGEGVAVDDQGSIYLISEPNLFYVFRKDTP
mgnify:FL=1